VPVDSRLKPILFLLVIEDFLGLLGNPKLILLALESLLEIVGAGVGSSWTWDTLDALLSSITTITKTDIDIGLLDLFIFQIYSS
jgi:hypothetical protein